jgi:hypothetical protein
VTVFLCPAVEWPLSSKISENRPIDHDRLPSREKMRVALIDIVREYEVIILTMS